VEVSSVWKITFKRARNNVIGPEDGLYGVRFNGVFLHSSILININTVLYGSLY